ncbi:hypothetical protein [Lentibacillus saliphilus]|uniref:hypothetical protein n=1 Tax=Lentibacillus saliphilus TaxID=2737028 RepID=UPI001C3084D1|nr:hypothetical protein [Lentibacillus saliphilus]
MCVLVENCFHWVGYHLVQQLLDDNEEVDGIDDQRTLKQVHLAMYVARHAQFQLLQNPEINWEERQYSIHITVDTSVEVLETKPNGALTLTTSSQDTSTSDTIELPLLFGEWMPMTEDGMYRENGDWIGFQSEQFANEAVYVVDFMKVLVHCIKKNLLDSTSSSSENRNKSLAKCVKIQDNSPMNTNLETVKAHYIQHKTYY